MAILLPGGAGFIGSHTAVELLNKGREIVIIDNFSNSTPKALESIKKITGKDFKFYEMDYLDREKLEKVFEENNIEAVNNRNSLWGEGKPILENLFEKQVEVEKNGITFLKHYYDYNFTEMMYKLSCLSYMLKTYFLPLHLSIHSSTVQERVFANDIKLLTKASVSLTEKPILISESNNSFSEVYLLSSFKISISLKRVKIVLSKVCPSEPFINALYFFVRAPILTNKITVVVNNATVNIAITSTAISKICS